MNIGEAIESIRAKLARSTSTVADGIADFRVRIREKAEELRHAERAPLPLEDLRQRIAARVEADSAAWLDRNAHALVARERSLGVWMPKNGIVSLPDVGSWGAICAARPEAAEAHLEALVARALERHPPGAPLADRQALVDRLQGELGQLDQAEEQLVDELNSRGLKLEHRPEVTRRREAAERAAALALRKAAAEAAADDGRPRTREVMVGPGGERLSGRSSRRSEYIESGGRLP